MNYLFYESVGITDQSSVDFSNYSSYSIRFWKPSLNKIFPLGLSEKRFAFWWFMHQSRFFTNRDYSVLLIFQGNDLIHRSCVFPHYFRYPIMKDNDLQIGDTFTDQRYRGKGIATYAILNIIEFLKMNGRKFWYIVEENNKPSIRVIEKVGFKRIGSGIRTSKLGLKLLGSFIFNDDTSA
jgi:RimJ/RimL family protein N-acetyltransferase